MREVIDIGSDTWAPNSKPNFNFQQLSSVISDRFARLACVIVTFVMNVTTNATGEATAREILEWISSIVFKNSQHNFCPGVDAYALAMLNYVGGEGGVDSVPAVIANNEVGVDHVFRVLFPFSRRCFIDGQDLAIPITDMLDANLKMQLGPAAFGTATLTVNSCSIDVQARISHSMSLVAPPLPTVNQFNGLLAGPMDAGKYSELIIVPPVGGFAAVGNLANLNVKGGGSVFLDSVGPDAAIAAYFSGQPMAGMNLGGDDWTRDFASLLFFPILYMDDFDKQLFADVADTLGKPLVLDCDGSLASPDLAFRYYTDPDNSEVDKTIENAGGVARGTVAVRESSSGEVISPSTTKMVPGTGMIPVKIKLKPGGDAGVLSSRLKVFSAK